jgi:hypothetical protein
MEPVAIRTGSRVIVSGHNCPGMTAGIIVLLGMARGALADDLNLAPIPWSEIVNIRMTLRTGKVFLGLVDAPFIFACLLCVTDIAVHRPGRIYPLGMFLQVYDVHVAARTGIVAVYRTSIFLDLYFFTVTSQTVLSQGKSLHLNIDGGRTRMDRGR